jgi:hypothetical protein
MKVTKTRGFAVEGKTRKGYAIHTDSGDVIKANPCGSQGYMTFGGAFYSTLRSLKDAIEAGELNEADEPTESSTLDGADTWDCMHPCALLILMEETYFYLENKLETLDAYGWLDCMGRPDIARAERESKRVENLKKGN